MNIIFLSPPAAGKGTYSELLTKDYGFNHISAGDAIRHQITSGTKLGEKVKDLVSSGKLIDDELVNNLMKEEIKTFDLNTPIIWDGYPRSVKQAGFLKALSVEENLGNTLVIYLKIDEDIALKRIIGRRNCPKCSKIYNVLTGHSTPLVENKCDVCNETLVSRTDDNEESYLKRLTEYKQSTYPLVEHYLKEGNLFEIDASRDTTEVYSEIKKVLGI